MNEGLELGFVLGLFCYWFVMQKARGALHQTLLPVRSPFPVPVHSSPILGKKRSLTVDKLKIECRLEKERPLAFYGAFSALATEGE
jgi:hypothetical protein